MMDHDPLAQASFEFTLTGFSMFAYTNMNPGDAIMISYGPNKSNLDLLFSHGFCVLNNPHEIVEVWVDNLKCDLKFGLQPLKLFDFALKTCSDGGREIFEDVIAQVQNTTIQRENVDESSVKIPSQLEFSNIYRKTRENIVNSNVAWLREALCICI